MTRIEITRLPAGTDVLVLAGTKTRLRRGDTADLTAAEVKQLELTAGVQFKPSEPTPKPKPDTTRRNS